MKRLLLRLWDVALCRLRRCRRCVALSTHDGIGGQCLRCGRVHGWVTRDQLLRLTPLFAVLLLVADELSL